MSDCISDNSDACDTFTVEEDCVELALSHGIDAHNCSQVTYFDQCSNEAVCLSIDYSFDCINYAAQQGAYFDDCSASYGTYECEDGYYTQDCYLEVNYNGTFYSGACEEMIEIAEEVFNITEECEEVFD